MAKAEFITYTLSCCFIDGIGPIKVSVGVATYPDCAEDKEKLLILRAKDQNKNGFFAII